VKRFKIGANGTTRKGICFHRESLSIGRMALNYLVELAQSGVGKQKRKVLEEQFLWLLDGQDDRSADRADLSLIASKIYRRQLSSTQQQDLCRTVCALFTFCLVHRDITPPRYQQAMLYFRQADGELPSGVMSLDQIRTALHEAPTTGSKLCLVLGLTTDQAVWPMREVHLRDVHVRDSKHLENTADGTVQTLNSWLGALPSNTGLLIRGDSDYAEACETLRILGFPAATPVFKQTRLAYRSALLGPMARFATQRCISMEQVKKYTTVALDWWSGYAFRFGLTPEGCGIASADWAAQLASERQNPGKVVRVANGGQATKHRGHQGTRTQQPFTRISTL
jgi:hypothetical protein